MGTLFQVNENRFNAKNPFVEGNSFIGKKTNNEPLPVYEEIKNRLPRPVWEGHEDVIHCYDKAWEIAFRNLRKANLEAGFVSDFIDTAFNGFLFMWDSAFILQFGKYANRIFDFQQTLDNFYANQHKDGFICRELCEEQKGAMWARDNPESTGPNILAWAEWEYYLQTGDKARIARVFDPLCGFHKWLQYNRSWPDGSYWSCNLSCGMDNQPRIDPRLDRADNHTHGFMSWIDTCAQQYLNGVILVKMAKVLGRESEVQWLKSEAELLENTVLHTMWSEKDSFYFDKFRDGKLSNVKSVGAYWTLLADLVPEARRDAFVAHLNNEKEFKRPNRVPALSADHPAYDRVNGDYFKGGVWASTNYMVLKGLEKHGYHQLAYEIATDYLRNVVEVFCRYDTLFENYAPECAAPGRAKPDFVGWTGLAPISILFEFVFGIKADAQNRKITWHINRTEGHGIENYPLGDATVDLFCEKRNSPQEKPVVRVKSDLPVEAEILWNGKREIIKA